MHWIAANHKIEGAISVSVAGKTYRPTDATTIELPGPTIYAIDPELGRDGRASGIKSWLTKIGFVSSTRVVLGIRQRVIIFGIWYSY
jgi:hypothetical protein